MGYKTFYTHNESSFSEYNLLSCYWAGFIAADGCIDKNHGRYNMLRVHLNRQDEEHLFKLKDYLKYTGEIKQRPARKNTKESSIITICKAEKIISDLYTKFNITPKKSLTYKPPSIKQLGLENSLAFLGGYIDGDGCVHYNKTKHKFSISIVGTSSTMSFIKDISDIILYKYTSNIISSVNIFPTYCQFSLTNYKSLVFLYNIYKLDLPVLDRKWDKFIDYFKHTFNIHPYNCLDLKEKINEFKRKTGVRSNNNCLCNSYSRC